MTVNFWAIVPAAGIGKRMQASCPKQYLSLHGKSILQHSIEALLAVPVLQNILVVISAHDCYWPQVHAALDYNPKIITTIGGEERFNSVYQGLLALSTKAKAMDWVLVHDAVRPWIKVETIERLISELQDHSVGGLLGIPCRDTLKRSDAQGNVVATVARQDIWLAQTPQMFRYQDLCQALQQIISQKTAVTDEAAAIELLGKMPRMVLGDADNNKVTYPADLGSDHCLQKIK